MRKSFEIMGGILGLLAAFFPSMHKDENMIKCLSRVNIFFTTILTPKITIYLVMFGFKS